MKPGNISGQAIQKATGKSWDEWFELLEKIKASELNHKEIASKLYDE